MLGEWNDKMTRKSNSKAFLSNKSNNFISMIAMMIDACT